MLDANAKYVYEVYRQKSVSLAAKALFVSQPALSAAIKKAEKALGAPIFDRRTLPFSLTPEGKVYIAAVEKMMNIKRQTEDQIRQIRQLRGGVLKLATSTHVSFYVIPRILETFHKMYPQVEVNIIQTHTAELYDLLEKEMADMILIRTDVIPGEYAAAELFAERLVVAMPLGHPGSEQLSEYAVSYEELISGTCQKQVTDMSVFQGVEFLYTPPNTNLYKKGRLLFGKSDIIPFITANAGRQQLDYNLMKAGFGALLTTDANIATMPASDRCMYFVLGGKEAEQSFSIVYPRQERGSTGEIRDVFVSVAKELFRCENPLKELTGE